MYLHRNGDGKWLMVECAFDDRYDAPMRFLGMVWCNCKTGCAMLRCSCRKTGLDCTVACGDCHGTCSNAPALDAESDDDTDVDCV